MTTSREHYYTAILDEISIGSTVPMGGGFFCANLTPTRGYVKPWTLDEMEVSPDDEEPWVLREYEQTALLIARPVPDTAALEKKGWHELATLRRQIARNRLQTVWFRALTKPD